MRRVQRGIVIILDNAVTHRAKTVQYFIGKEGVIALYLPT